MSIWKKITYTPTDEEAEIWAENLVKTIKKWFPFAVMILMIMGLLAMGFFITVYPTIKQ